MEKRILYLILLIAVPLIARSQADSDVDFYGCTVQSGGDVVLSWTPLSSSADFASYDVFHAAGSGAFARVASISNSTIGTWTHAGAASDLQVHRYYVQAFTSGAPASPSDTLFTILPTITIHNDVEVRLNWGFYSSHPIAGAEPYYHIYRRFAEGSWALIDSTLLNSFSDTPGVCLSELTYRVSWRANKNQNFSNLTQPILDAHPPVAPVMDSVSVAENGDIIFGWEQGESPDTRNYFILHHTTTWDTLDHRLFHHDTTTYTSTTVHGYSGPQEFCIASVDRCGNSTSDNGIPLAVKTIWLQTPVHHVCEKRIELNWTPYIRMKDGLAGYKILVSENNAPYYLYKTLSPDTLTAFFDNPQHQVFYRFKIVAVGNSGITASSSVGSLTVHNPAAPQYCYIRYATVKNNRSVALAIINDSTAQTAGLVIERSKLSPVVFYPLDTLIPQGSMVYYNDSMAHTSKEPYLYRVAALDSCGSPEIISNQINTLWLTLNNAATGTLLWTPHEGFPNGLSHYRIERRSPGSDWQTLDELTTTTFTDPAYPELIPLQTLEYRVTAIASSNDIVPYSDTAASNIITAVPTYRMFVPTAFRPAGETNSIFKPVMLSVDAGDYYFAIFNRQGQRIFETTQMDQGWDGTLNGDRLKSGIYAYYIRILTVSGRYHEQRGMVTLMD